jgi:hypothetical protein
VELPATAWLTAFEDTASPRPGNAEVFFDPASDRSVVHPPDILIHGPPVIVPVELAFLAVGCLGLIAWAAWKRVRRSTAR